MARLNKKGLVYFPLEVDFFTDRKIRRLNIRTNYIGGQIYLFILTLIYQNSYYIETTVDDLTEDIISAFPDKDIFTFDFVKKVINICVEIELFDKKLADKGVFTSKGIQKQYLLSTKRRKDVDTSSYWILDLFEEAEIRIKIKEDEVEQNVDSNSIQENNCMHNVDNNNENVCKNSVESDNCEHHVDQSTQSKKKRERDKTDKTDKTNLYGLPSLHYLTKVLIKNEYIDDFCLDIPKFNSLFEELCRAYDFDNVCIATNYLIQYSKRADPPIDFPYAFFSTSIMNALSYFQEESKHIGETFEEWVKRSFK